ncbi:PA0050 family protein [Pseudomonas aeruginosa]
MKQVLLTVVLLCGVSLTAQAACPVFRPSADPCIGPGLGP